MDFSQLSDIQLDHMLGQIGADPFTSDYSTEEALRAEKRRRLAARNRLPVPVVETPTPGDFPDGAEAAATPIAPDPTVGAKPSPRTWRDMSDAEMLEPLADESGPGGGLGVRRGDLPAYGQRYQQAVAGRIDSGVAARQAARAQGYQDPEQIEYNAATGLPYSPPAAPTGRRAPPPEREPLPVYAGRSGEGYTDPSGRQMVMVGGAVYPADSPMAQELAPFAPTDYGHGTMMVDGVEVGIVRPADPLMNQPAQYRLVDVEREKERRREYEATRMRRESSIRENERFGSPYLPRSEWTDEQARAREERAAAQIRGSNRGYAHEQRVRTLADQLGVSEDVAAAAYEQALASAMQDTTATDVPGQQKGGHVRGVGYAPGQLVDAQGLLTPAGVGHVMRTARRAILAGSENNGAVDRRQAQKAYARDAVVRRAQAKQNPLEYLQNPTVNDWGQFVMASSLLGSPQGPTPLGVEAFNAQRAAEMAQRAVTGMLANNQPGAADAAERMRSEQRMQNLRKVAGQAKNDSWSADARADVTEVLEREGATPLEIKMILGELFGSESSPNPAPPAPPSPTRNPANAGRAASGLGPVM